MIDKDTLFFYDPFNDETTHGTDVESLTRFFELFEMARSGDNNPLLYRITCDNIQIPVPLVTVPCLSVRQPWAHFIVRGNGILMKKDVENRTWKSKYKGPLLIHAAQKFESPRFLSLQKDKRFVRGGVIGIVTMTGCKYAKNRKARHSHWHQVHRWGFILENQIPISFYPSKGRLKIYRQPIPSIILEDAGVDLKQIEGESNAE